MTYLLYPNGAVEEVHPPRRVPAPIAHNVKFRHADTTKTCASEGCPYPMSRIAEGEKYARVQRVNARKRGVTELFHPRCYDWEFEQGGSDA